MHVYIYLSDTNKIVTLSCPFCGTLQGCWVGMGSVSSSCRQPETCGPCDRVYGKTDQNHGGVKDERKSERMREWNGLTHKGEGEAEGTFGWVGEVREGEAARKSFRGWLTDTQTVTEQTLPRPQRVWFSNTTEIWVNVRHIYFFALVSLDLLPLPPLGRSAGGNSQASCSHPLRNLPHSSTRWKHLCRWPI